MHYPNLQDTPTLGKLTEADLDSAIAAKVVPLSLRFSAAPPALLPIWPALPPVYRAGTGRQRAFLSVTGAAAYDWGYSTYPGAMRGEPGTPEAMGWADARGDAEGAAGMDDTADWAFTHASECGRHTP